MSTTTVGDLLARAHHLSADLSGSGQVVTNQQWRQFDVTAYRLLSIVADLCPIAPPIEKARLARILDAYPLPLNRARGRAVYTPRQFAPHFGYGLDAVLARVRDATLLATMRNDTWRIDGDNHAPLDRLAVTLGATADLLCTEQPRAFDPAPDDCAALTGRLLALTVVAARHALSRLPLADADRPLVVGRYAEQALDDQWCPTAGVVQMTATDPGRTRSGRGE